MAYMYPGQKKFVYLAECHDLNERNRQMVNHEKTENFYDGGAMLRDAYSISRISQQNPDIPLDDKAFIHSYLGHSTFCIIANKPIDEITLAKADSLFQAGCYHEHDFNFPLDYSHLQYVGDEKVLNDFVKDIRTAHKDADIPAQTLDNFEIDLD